MQARPAKKRKTLMYSWHTAGELFGSHEAGQLIGSQPSQNSNTAVLVPDSIYSIFPNVLNEVGQMVTSLPTREVKRAKLNEKIQNLTNVAFPNKSDPLI